MQLDNATTGIVQAPRRIFIYGDGGLGKSTFLAEAGRTRFIDTQDGTANIPGASRFNPRPETFADVLECIDELTEKDHSYTMLAIDLVDDVEQWIYNHICRRDGKANIEDYGFNKGPAIALNEWRGLLARLERLRTRRGIMIAFSGHAGVNKFKNPEGGDYGRHGPMINEKASALLRGWCDTVLFAREQTFAKTDETKRTRGFSTGVRVIHTVGTASFYAKNRDNLPDTISLDWGEFDAAVKAGVPAGADAMLAEIQTLMGRLDAETFAKVQASTEEAGQDPNKLLRVLGRLREKLTENAQDQQQDAHQGENGSEQ